MSMKQRSDYTFKYNKKLGRHGWLRLTPAYSVKLVQELLSNRNLFEDRNFGGGLILDPFCGTATTGIVAAELGMECILYEINPFLAWFGTIKSLNFNSIELHDAFEKVTKDLAHITFSEQSAKDWIPPMKNIERWWNQETIIALAVIRRYISSEWGEPGKYGVKNLIWVAFARLVIETSAADFNHISVSFKDDTQDLTNNDIILLFTEILSSIVESAKESINGKAEIILGDSRFLSEDSAKFDLVITSPPYPNRISYIRELRPYMYWLGFLESGEQAGELDWKAIGGTWGSATSKLSTWKAVNDNLPSCLLESCRQIEAADGKNGKTMSQYVLKFFDDMFIHLSNLRKRLNDGAEIHYILGNSSFYGNFVDTDNIIKEMLYTLEYSSINSQIIRKRNCNKGLFEYHITARWHNV